MSNISGTIPPDAMRPIRDSPSSVVPPARRRHVLRWVVLLLSVLVVGLLATVADGYVQALSASRELRELVPLLQGAREDLLKNPEEATRLHEAEAKMQELQARVDGARFTFGLTGVLPFLGRPVKAVELGTDAASEVIAGVRLGSDIAGDLTGGASGRGLIDDGTIDLALVRGLEPRVAQVVAHLEAARADLTAIPSIPFFGQLTRLKEEAITEADDALASGRRVMSATKLLPSLLGADGPRTYFLALQNNSDQRGTGGAVLGWGIVRMVNGSIKLGGGGSINDIDVTIGPNIPVPAPIRWFSQITHRPRRINNGINYSPDFPSVASTWAHVLEATRGVQIDGVIAIDPAGVSALLKGQGSVRVPSYDKPLDSGNIVQFAEHDQYALPQSAQAALPAEMVSAAFGALTAPRDLLSMGQSMSGALADKRIQLWTEDRPAEDLIHTLGWDGAIERGGGDYLYLTDNKRNPNKVDYFTQLSVDYRVTVDPDGTGHSSTKVTVDNTTPPGEPAYVVGPFKPYAVNVAMLGLYVPKRTTAITVTPDTPPAFPRVLPKGLRYHTDSFRRVLVKVVEAWPGHPGEATFGYRTPDLVEDTPQGKLYRLVVQHQPMAHPVHLHVTLTLPEGSSATSMGPGWSMDGNVATFSAEVDKDFETTLLYR